MRPVLFLLVGVILLVSAGCGDEETPPTATVTPAAESPAGAQDRPAAAGAELFQYIVSEKYGDWKMWPGKEAFYPGTEPHGSLLTTYVTDGAFAAIESKQGSIPEGEIIVKENYTPERKLDALTVMYKVSGYDPASNDWFWVKYKPDGQIEAEGKVEGCITCHGQQRSNDFIMTGPLT